MNITTIWHRYCTAYTVRIHTDSAAMVMSISFTPINKVTLRQSSCTQPIWLAMVVAGSCRCGGAYVSRPPTYQTVYCMEVCIFIYKLHARAYIHPRTHASAHYIVMDILNRYNHIHAYTPMPMGSQLRIHIRAHIYPHRRFCDWSPD